MQFDLTTKTLHFKKPARTSRGEYTLHEMVIVTATRDDGTVGRGECAPLPDLSCDRGEYGDLGHVRSLIDNAMASGDYAAYLRPYPALLFALESAINEANQLPLLYDTPFARGEAGIPTNGLVWMASYDDMLGQIKQKIANGFRCVKLKIGAIDWDDEIRLIEFIRSRFGRDELELRVDANGAFGPDDAMDKLNQLARYDIHSIEQPVRQGRWDLMAGLCRRSPLPIALDEELIGVNDLDGKRRLLDTINPQYIVIKPTLHGGMTGTCEWVDEARQRGIGSWMTSALESNIGLRNVALLAASVYGPDNDFPQGLGTGLLFTDNIPYGIELKGSKIYITQ
ncbi:MAG: o-succinylbenzoate synthase [Bacteroidales bacterium]|nr:o-succinylbenzoate synthase [Candidatus Sodaliphilus aphodohippi]